MYNYALSSSSSSPYASRDESNGAAETGGATAVAAVLERFPASSAASPLRLMTNRGLTATLAPVLEIEAFEDEDEAAAVDERIDAHVSSCGAAAAVRIAPPDCTLMLNEDDDDDETVLLLLLLLLQLQLLPPLLLFLTAPECGADARRVSPSPSSSSSFSSSSSSTSS